MPRSPLTVKNPPPPAEGLLPRTREWGKSGFWVPNELVDLHARDLGSRG